MASSLSFFTQIKTFYVAPECWTFIKQEETFTFVWEQ